MSAYEPKRTSVVCLERRFRDRFGFPKTQRMLMEGTRRAVSTWLSFAFAQQTQAPKRVGLMANLPLPPVLRFRERLQKLSWVDGKISSSNIDTGKAGMTTSQICDRACVDASGCPR